MPCANDAHIRQKLNRAQPFLKVAQRDQTLLDELGINASLYFNYLLLFIIEQHLKLHVRRVLTFGIQNCRNFNLIFQ